MPGAQNIARQILGQIDAVKIAGFRAIVRQCPADRDLSQKKQRNNQTILDDRLLAGGGAARQHVGMKVPCDRLSSPGSRICRM